MSALSRRILAVRADLEAGAEVDPERVAALCAEVEAQAPGMAPAQAQELLAALRAVAALVVSRRDEAGAALADLGRAHSGIKGYAALRSMHTEQRLSKRA